MPIQPPTPAGPPIGRVDAAADPPTVHPSPTIMPRKRLNSLALFGGEREIEIEHSGQLYRLRLTSLGKLILTK